MPLVSERAMFTDSGAETRPDHSSVAGAACGEGT